jgi:two-component system CheB/CheR fusion protein
LQSSNEELQSSNEELESVNEELQNLNSEHQAKIVELTKAHEDLDNFISSADIATIFLDSGLRIRRFTPSAAARTGLMPHDVGREISAFSHPLLIEAARAGALILAGGTPRIESSFPGEKGDTMLMRAVPFIRKDGTRTGAAVTFIQINSPAS